MISSLLNCLNTLDIYFQKFGNPSISDKIFLSLLILMFFSSVWIIPSFFIWEIGKVNISGSTYELVKDKFKCIHRGKIQAKNKGEIDMYFVESR